MDPLVMIGEVPSHLLNLNFESCGSQPELENKPSEFDAAEPYLESDHDQANTVMIGSIL